MHYLDSNSGTHKACVLLHCALSHISSPILVSLLLISVSLLGLSTYKITLLTVEIILFVSNLNEFDLSYLIGLVRVKPQAPKPGYWRDMRLEANANVGNNTQSQGDKTGLGASTCKSLTPKKHIKTETTMAFPCDPGSLLGSSRSHPGVENR